MQVLPVESLQSFRGLLSRYGDSVSTQDGDYRSYEHIYYYPFKDETEAEINAVRKSEPEEHFFCPRQGLGSEIETEKTFTLEKRLEFTRAEYSQYKNAQRSTGYVLSNSELMIKNFLTENKLYSHMHNSDYRELFPTFGQKIKKFFARIFKPQKLVL